MTELVRQLLSGLREMNNQSNSKGEEEKMEMAINTTNDTNNTNNTNGSTMSALDFLSGLKELQKEQKAAEKEAAAQAAEEKALRIEKSREFVQRKSIEVVSSFLRMQNEGMNPENTHAEESIRQFVSNLPEEVLDEGVYVKMAIGMGQPVNYGLYDFSVDPDGKEGGRRLNLKIRLVPLKKRLSVFLKNVAMVNISDDEELRPLMAPVLDHMDNDWHMPVCRKTMVEGKKYLENHPDTKVYKLNVCNFAYFTETGMVILTTSSQKLSGKWTFDVHNARQG